MRCLSIGASGERAQWILTLRPPYIEMSVRHIQFSATATPGIQLLGVALPLLTGCATMLAGPAAPPPAVEVSAIVARVVPSPQTTALLRHSGVAITLAPTRFDTVSTPGCTYQPAPQSLLEIMPNGVSLQTHEKWVETRFNDLVVAPDRLSFLLTIKNGMNRVFRGAGAIVQFNVDQQVQAVEQSNYLEFINALIPPGGESQVRIAGPPLTALRDSATLGVFLYDVVTEIDKAGNVTKRENFEWYFHVRRERIIRQAESARRSMWVHRSALGQIVEATPGGGRRLRDGHGCLAGSAP